MRASATRVDDMILPPIAHDVKVISIGMFVPGNQAVVWRGPMLHRALEQFLTDVFWDEPDFLLICRLIPVTTTASVMGSAALGAITSSTASTQARTSTGRPA